MCVADQLEERFLAPVGTTQLVQELAS